MRAHVGLQSIKGLCTDAGLEIREVDSGDVLKRASVPEHSVHFMRSMSGGEPFTLDEYLFFAEDDWLMAIGYPLSGEYDPDRFAQAVYDAVRITRAVQCWAVCPRLPETLEGNRRENDEIFILDASAKPCTRLLKLADKASRSLRVDMSQNFTRAHQLLWDEFLGTRNLPPRVAGLYSRTEKVLRRTRDLFLLNAWDRKDNLAACLLVDLAPCRFLSYIVGAHSRRNYTPNASDLLFREMFVLAGKLKKEFIHLGIGVNPGIRRFKTKWGGRSYLGYDLAEWTLADRSGLFLVNQDLMHNKLSYFNSLPQQKKFRMLWEVEKQGKVSLIGGSAHFFPHSFRYHFRRLFNKAETVLFEGPLDKASMEIVARLGKSPAPGSQTLSSMLKEEEVRHLEKVVQGPKGFWAGFMGMASEDAPDVRYFMEETRPWMALFSLWSGFLRRMDWKQSVDREAWELAKDMDKDVVAMERIEEQIQTLESIPIERIINFFRSCGQWKKMARKSEKAYLKGDLENLLGTSVEFPSRTEYVIQRRDELFLERMTPYLNQGDCLVFVGSAHMLSLGPMLAKAGYRVRKAG